MSNDFTNIELEKISVVEDIEYINNAMTLVIGERRLRLEGNFKNLGQIQRRTGMKEMQLILEFSRTNFGILDMATIFFYAIEDKDNRFRTVEELGDAILKEKRYVEYAAACVGFLALVLSDGRDLGKSNTQPEPEEEKKSQAKG